MAQKLTFHYDRVGDILHIDRVAPYAEQETEELDSDVLARVNPDTGEIESLEILAYEARLAHGDRFELPVFADLRRVV
jgi:hypothetical protein